MFYFNKKFAPLYSYSNNFFDYYLFCNDTTHEILIIFYYNKIESNVVTISPGDLYRIDFWLTGKKIKHSKSK